MLSVWLKAKGPGADKPHLWPPLADSMPVSSTRTSAYGILFAVCLALCLACATGTLGLNAFLVNGAEGGSTGATVVTFVSAAFTWVIVIAL